MKIDILTAASALSDRDLLARLSLLARNGDPAAIFDRAVRLLLDHVERTKLGKAARPRREPAIRPGTDNDLRTPPPSRYLPRTVRRAVWRRDGGRCAFVSPTGLRCTERTFLEFHHVQPYAKGGPATVANISVRCRAHNHHASEVVFGAPGPDGYGSMPRLNPMALEPPIMDP
jgi:5-methylcytosine-specific restriction endonuclease McrA